LKRLAFLLCAGVALMMIPAVRAQHGAGPAAPAEHAGHAEQHGPSRVWIWVNFFLLAGGLGYLAAKQGGPFFKQRGEEIRKGIQDAARIKADAEARAAAIEKRMANIAADIDQLRERGAREAAAESERLSRETEQSLVKIKAQSARDIAAAAKSARQELKAYAADLALQLAEKKLRAELTVEADAGLMRNFVDNLRRQAQEGRN
jgi:F-type H+-transporting ATPase subunit b